MRQVHTEEFWTNQNLKSIQDLPHARNTHFVTGGGGYGGGTSQHILTFKKVHFYSTKHNSIKYNYILKIKIFFNIFNNNDNVYKVSISSTWEMIMMMMQLFHIVKNNDKINKIVVRFICDIFLIYSLGYF